MRWFFRFLARVFDFLASFCKRYSEPPQPKHVPIKADRQVAPEPKIRLKYLLSLEKLTSDEMKEIEDLTAGSGDIVFLDDPAELASQESL